MNLQQQSRQQTQQHSQVTRPGKLPATGSINRQGLLPASTAQPLHALPVHMPVVVGMSRSTSKHVLLRVAIIGQKV